MKSSKASLFVAACAILFVGAAPHTFTDQKGNKLDAELNGVKDGMVVLRQGQNRHIFPLAAFSLDDRDYIVSSLSRRDRNDSVRSLMNFAAEHGGRVLPPEVGGQSTSSGSRAEVGQIEAMPSLLYGLPIPSNDLLEPAASRDWTDLSGKKFIGAFKRINEAGFIILQLPNNAPSLIALVNLSRSDIDYVAELLEADAVNAIFPDRELVPISSEQKANGYRTWTDRDGRQLNARFVALIEGGDEVILEAGGEEARYPFLGLSREDRIWILSRQGTGSNQDSDLPHRIANADLPQPLDQSTLGNLPLPSNVRPSLPVYNLRCVICGNTFYSNSTYPVCENCHKTFHYTCLSCGNRWTQQIFKLETCPNCGDDLIEDRVTSASTGKVSSSVTTEELLKVSEQSDTKEARHEYRDRQEERIASKQSQVSSWKETAQNPVFGCAVACAAIGGLIAIRRRVF